MAKTRSGQNTSDVGHAAESVALAHLQSHGLQLVERNFRCKMGEIDLIMNDGRTLVFVEVRLRNNRQHLTGAESVTRSKMQRLIRTAQYYLVTHPSNDELEFRFDVISMGAGIDWIKEAFTLDD